jgi:hypothetical protein
MPEIKLGPLDHLCRIPVTQDDGGRLRRLQGHRLPFEWRGQPAGSLVLTGFRGVIGEGVILRFQPAPERIDAVVLDRMYPLGDFSPYLDPNEM